MPAQSKRKQAELFMQYPSIWKLARQLVLNGKLPEMKIQVTRAVTDTMDFRLDETPYNSGAYLSNWGDGQFAGLRGSGVDIVVALDKNHNEVATLYGSSRIKPVYVRDIFWKTQRPELIEYLLLLVTVKWHQPPTEDEQARDITFGERVGTSLDAFVLKRPDKMSWTELKDEAERLRKEQEEAYLYPPKNMPKLDGIERALKDGGRLHAFRSGGGLRVVTVTKRGKSVAYGEHPDISEALRHASEDFLAGGRKYKDVYGPGKLYPHYLTGSSTAASNLDSWVLQGHELEAHASRDRNSVVVRLKGSKQTEHPEGINDRVRGGETVQWEERGFTFESTLSGASVETKVVAMADGVDPSEDWFYKIHQTGTGSDFWNAAMVALEAEPVPVKRS